ncbi:related to DUF1338 domain protein [Fusarium fujikuroi]|nr:related to DUF1338 domain protein [Fusarium fujikuroi]
MTVTDPVSPDAIRAMFASALSSMYRREVPQYGTLLKLVSDINHQKHQPMEPRIEVERHGAIRLGTPEELAMMRRLFAVMGMHPEALAYNPFRVFTSLLRLELIEDETLRTQAADVLRKRNIFTGRCVELIKIFESQKSFSEEVSKEFIKEALETFRWHKTSTVDMKTYKALREAHPLIADVVCFKGPHINHLTPRVLDIETAQVEMLRYGLQAKDAIEGPPPRLFPILLRQTSFLALDEAIAFSEGEETGGSHKARFGEIEQRGMALTPKGRRLYDDLINEWRGSVAELTSDAKSGSKEQILAKIFQKFPDDLETIRKENLAYFTYSPVSQLPIDLDASIDSLVSSGAVKAEPITYEDFLPVSAAGIFHSNLGEDGGLSHVTEADQESFEKSLGCQVKREFELYSEMQEVSIQGCLER